jgi:glycosyltransferase involved in cell wall biosynthesis
MSIQKQKVPAEKMEIIVVDNGSTDHTPQIVRDMSIRIEVLMGVTVAALRNHGAKLACGELLAFVDADVEISVDWLEVGLTSFIDDHVVAIGGPRCMPQPMTWVQCAWKLHLDARRPKYQAAYVSWLYSMAFIVRRREFLALGGFADDLKTAEDVDLCYRLGRLGHILYDPAMKAVHWGEDPDLGTFWRKEVWRGMGTLGGLQSHGVRWDELPSLGYPVYILLFVAIFAVSCIIDFSNRQFAVSLLSLALIMLPATTLALTTVLRVKRIGALPSLFLLYLIYGFARAYSMVNVAVPWRA